MKRVLAFLFLLAFAPFPAYGQAVIDSSFCLDVQKNACFKSLPNGTTVKLSTLKKVNDKPTVYFLGVIRSLSDKAIAIMFQRVGTCIVEHISLPSKKFDEDPSGFAKFIGFFVGKTLADLWNLLGLAELGAGQKKDLKINAVFVPPSDGFKVWDWRHIECPGVMRARLFDSEGNPLLGNNDIREIKIVE